MGWEGNLRIHEFISWGCGTKYRQAGVGSVQDDFGGKGRAKK